MHLYIYISWAPCINISDTYTTLCLKTGYLQIHCFPIKDWPIYHLNYWLYISHNFPLYHWWWKKPFFGSANQKPWRPGRGDHNLGSTRVALKTRKSGSPKHYFIGHNISLFITNKYSKYSNPQINVKESHHQSSRDSLVYLFGNDYTGSWMW